MCTLRGAKLENRQKGQRRNRDNYSESVSNAVQVKLDTFQLLLKAYVTRLQFTLMQVTQLLTVPLTLCKWTTLADLWPSEEIYHDSNAELNNTETFYCGGTPFEQQWTHSEVIITVLGYKKGGNPRLGVCFSCTLPNLYFILEQVQKGVHAQKTQNKTVTSQNQTAQSADSSPTSSSSSKSKSEASIYFTLHHSTKCH